MNLWNIRCEKLAKLLPFILTSIFLLFGLSTVYSLFASRLGQFGPDGLDLATNKICLSLEAGGGGGLID
jgi:hypothetical protein